MSIETGPRYEALVFNLKEWQSYQNPDRKQLDRLIKEEEKFSNEFNSGIDTNYGSDWPEIITKYPDLAKKSDEVTEYLEKKLRGEVVVDLGSGDGVNARNVPASVRDVGAKTYIAVDKYHVPEEWPWPEEFENLERVAVKADLLDFISRMPSNSASFLLNGIDSFIVKTPEYHKALAKELSRVVKKGGVILGCQSTALQYLDENKFAVVKLKDMEDRFDSSKGAFRDSPRPVIYEKVG